MSDTDTDRGRWSRNLETVRTMLACISAGDTAGYLAHLADDAEYVALKTMIGYLRSLTATPILTGLPFGHVPTKVSMPFGRKVQVLVQARDVLVGW